MKIYYIAGHGAGDPGACGNGYTEAEQVRKLGYRLKELGGDQVILGDFSRDYYREALIGKADIPRDCAIIEGHQDAGLPTARGGHVIICDMFEPDEYDIALASSLSQILPGRAQTIVKRNNLANPYDAAQMGYNYRLVEFGFITSPDDCEIFNKRLDDICRAILDVFGINTEEGEEMKLCYIQRKGSDGQSLTDLHSVIKGVPSLAHKASMTAAIKHAHGYSPKTYVLEPADYDNIVKIIKG